MFINKWTHFLLFCMISVRVSALDAAKEASKIHFRGILSILNGFKSFLGYEPRVEQFLKRQQSYDKQFSDSMNRMLSVANMAIYHKKPGEKRNDDSDREMFKVVLNVLERIGKPVDMDLTRALYMQRIYVFPEGDTMHLRELRGIVEALLTGNATIPADEKGTKELHLLSTLYGIVLMKLQKRPFKIEALIEEMRWADGLYELTFRRSDGTRPLDVEQRHLDAIEELLEFYIKDIHSGVKTGKYPERFAKTIQKGLAGLKKRKSAWKESSLEEDEEDADEDEDVMHEEL